MVIIAATDELDECIIICCSAIKFTGLFLAFFILEEIYEGNLIVSFATRPEKEISSDYIQSRKYHSLSHTIISLRNNL